MYIHCGLSPPPPHQFNVINPIPTTWSWEVSPCLSPVPYLLSPPVTFPLYQYTTGPSFRFFSKTVVSFQITWVNLLTSSCKSNFSKSTNMYILTQRSVKRDRIKYLKNYGQRSTKFFNETNIRIAISEKMDTLSLLSISEHMYRS